MRTLFQTATNNLRNFYIVVPETQSENQKYVDDSEGRLNSPFAFFSGIDFLYFLLFK